MNKKSLFVLVSVFAAILLISGITYSVRVSSATSDSSVVSVAGWGSLEINSSFSESYTINDETTASFEVTLSDDSPEVSYSCDLVITLSEAYDLDISIGDQTAQTSDFKVYTIEDVAEFTTGQSNSYDLDVTISVSEEAETITLEGIEISVISTQM